MTPKELEVIVARATEKAQAPLKTMLQNLAARQDHILQRLTTLELFAKGLNAQQFEAVMKDIQCLREEIKEQV